MKLVLFMGSPRKNGNTAALAAPFLEECGQLGVEVETVWLYDKTILPCLGCKTCQDRIDGLGCVREDDVPDLFGAMERSDTIVLATPIYGWFCTAPMKALMDRAVYAGTKNYGRVRDRPCSGVRTLPPSSPAVILRRRELTCGRLGCAAGAATVDYIGRGCSVAGIWAPASHF